MPYLTLVCLALCHSALCHPALFYTALGRPALSCAALPCATLPCLAPSHARSALPSACPRPAPPCPALVCLALPCPALHDQLNSQNIYVKEMQIFSYKCMAGPFAAISMYPSTVLTISSALVTWLPIKDVLLF